MFSVMPETSGSSARAGGMRLTQIPYVGDGAAVRTLIVGFTPRQIFVYVLPAGFNGEAMNDDVQSMSVLPGAIAPQPPLTGTTIDAGSASVLRTLMGGVDTNTLGTSYLLQIFG